MRAGIWRLLAVLKDHGIHGTFFVPALDAENNTQTVEAVLKAGHEVAARGYAFEDHSKLEARERETLARAHEVLTTITGRAPAGWRAHIRRSSGVVFMTCQELAAWWRARQPEAEPAPV